MNWFGPVTVDDVDGKGLVLKVQQNQEMKSKALSWMVAELTAQMLITQNLGFLHNI